MAKISGIYSHFNGRDLHFWAEKHRTNELETSFGQDHQSFVVDQGRVNLVFYLFESSNSCLQVAEQLRLHAFLKNGVHFGYSPGKISSHQNTSHAISVVELDPLGDEILLKSIGNQKTLEVNLLLR